MLEYIWCKSKCVLVNENVSNVWGTLGVYSN